MKMKLWVIPQIKYIHASDAPKKGVQLHRQTNHLMRDTKMVVGNSEYSGRWIAMFLSIGLAACLVATGAAQIPAQITTAGFLESFSAVPSPTTDPATIQEIMAIRDRLGGGLTKSLEGLLLPKADRAGDHGDSSTGKSMSLASADFAFALQSIVSAGPKTINDAGGGRTQIDSCTVLPINGELATAPNPAESQVESNSSRTLPENSQEVAHRLRQVAHQLDILAADLEDIEHFEHADHLRRAAAQLREQVRNAKSLNPATLLK